MTISYADKAKTKQENPAPQRAQRKCRENQSIKVLTFSVLSVSSVVKVF